MENKVMTEEGKPLRGFIGLGDIGRLMAQDLLAAAISILPIVGQVV